MSDVAKLKEAIEDARKRLDTGDYTTQIVYAPNLRLLADAAEKHLATLPKTKPMWFVIYQSQGELCMGQYDSAQDAHASWAHGAKFVRVIATVGPYEVPDDLP